MNSLEIVDIINSQRKEGESELQHKHFLEKVPKVIGEGYAKFSATYVHPQNGQTSSLLPLPQARSLPDGHELQL